MIGGVGEGGATLAERGLGAEFPVTWKWMLRATIFHCFSSEASRARIWAASLVNCRTPRRSEFQPRLLTDVEDGLGSDVGDGENTIRTGLPVPVVDDVITPSRFR